MDKNVIFDRSDDTAFKNARNQVQSVMFENLSISGNFTISITNNGPSGSGNKIRDVVDILNIYWK